MQVFGIDPGFNYTGVAMVDFPTDDQGKPVWEEAIYDGVQEWSPVDAMRWILRRMDPDPRTRAFVVEGFVGSGHLTKEAKETLLVLGYFKYCLPEEPHVQVPQARLSRVREAKALIEDLYPDLPQPMIKDTVAALAHALTYTHLAYGQQ